MTKTIKISVSTHNALSELASKKDTFNDVISFLINYYKSKEEFTDDKAEFYNNEIENFENGNFENITKLTLKDIEERIRKLEEIWKMNYELFEHDRVSKFLKKTWKW